MFRRLLISSLCGFLSCGLAWAKSPKPAAAPPRPPTVQELIKGFMFIGDFDVKEEMRPNSKEIFWRYPFKLPKIGFEFDVNSDFKSAEMARDFPATEGEGRAIQHLNNGRTLFLDGDIELARKTWLSAKSRYGKSYDYHRRTDYFIAESFLYTGLDLLKKANFDFNRFEVRQSLVNASTFLSWAFDRKKDLYDPALDRVAPRAYYNQAVIHFNYERWAGVFGTATLGLDFLRQKGGSSYRREFRRMLAETHIRNRDYLEAVRELDLTLREDEALDTAAAIFARIGDVYMDLNNFELAEEVYGLAGKVDRELKYVRPSQYVLRGESLFWMGRFPEAIKVMQYAQQASAMPSAYEDPGSNLLPLARDELDDDMQALASIRIADSWLALGNLEKAKLAYFEHAHEFRRHITAVSAKLRLACLELPYYDGNNIQHARELLAELKDQVDLIPPAAQEMGWTCEMASFAQHERTPAMVDRVRVFAKKYPDSEFLQQLIQPVREVQAKHIDGYFKAGDAYGAVQFFERTRQALFPEVKPALAKQLFAAYVDIHQAEKASDFFDVYRREALDDMGWLRLATASVELAEKTEGTERSRWQKMEREISAQLFRSGLQLPDDLKVKLFISRILATAAAKDHYPWILALAMKWADRDISIICDLVMPIYKRGSAPSLGELSQARRQQSKNFIDLHLANLLRFETNCAYSLMEYEIDLYADEVEPLATKYLTRDYLNVNQTSAGLVWNLAERSYTRGYAREAEALWKMLVDKGDGGLSEVRYARMRLDKRRTELEGLWER